MKPRFIFASIVGMLVAAILMWWGSQSQEFRSSDLQKINGRWPASDQSKYQISDYVGGNAIAGHPAGMTSSEGGEWGPHKSHKKPLDAIIDEIPGGRAMAAPLFAILGKRRINAVNAYLEIAGVNPNENSNSGVVLHNQRLLDHPKQCLNRLAGQFYADLAVDGMAIGSKPENLLFAAKRRDVPVSLEENVKDVGVEPGWLWQKAMKYSKGDGNLAMQLIGLCGHDNTSQGMYFDFNEILTKNLAKDLIQESGHLAREVCRRPEVGAHLLQLNGYRSVCFEKLEHNYLLSEDIFDTEEVVAEVYDAETGMYSGGEYEISKFPCPPMAHPMYRPESLGKDVDISKDLKDKISSTQAPNMGPSGLPAKYYHLMGAAYMSCNLFQLGIGEKWATRINRRGINAYRSKRICELVNDNLSDNENYDAREVSKVRLAKFLKRKNLDKLLQEYEKNLSSCQDLDYWDTNFSPQALSNFPNHCSLLFVFNGDPVEKSDVENFIQEYQDFDPRMPQIVERYINRNPINIRESIVKFRDDPYKCGEVSEFWGVSYMKNKASLREFLKKPNFCRILLYADYHSVSDIHMSVDDLVEKINTFDAKKDAARGFTRSIAYKKSDNCTGLHIDFSVRDFLKRAGSLGRHKFCPPGERVQYDKRRSHEICEKGWSCERCNAAREVMGTWAVDFLWSDAQHVEGVKFAAKHCSPLPDNKTIEDLACDALESENTVSPRRKGTESGR